MKNLYKSLATQSRWLCAIALVAVIGFSFAACDNGSGGGDGGGDDGDDPSAYLGEKIEISGEQVYTVAEDGYTISKYDGNLSITDTGGGKGTIANGKLTFTIGIPDDLEIMEGFFPSEGDKGADTWWKDIKYEPSDAQYFDIYGLHITGSKHDIDYNLLVKGNVSGTDNNGWWEEVSYVYVDRDVTITGKGATGDNHDGDTWKTEDFKLSFKKGWNAMCWKDSWKGDTETESFSLRNPKNAKWMLVRDYDD